VLAAAVAAQSLSARIEALQRDGVRVGVCAMTPEGGTLFSWRANQAFVPASNQKLLTAACVLTALGPDFRFRTPVRLEGGTLVLEAGGDPNWRTGGEHDPRALFDRVAAELAAAGVRALRGVVFDDSRFPGPDRPSGWPSDQLDQPYCAPTSGFAVDANCFRVALRPGGSDVAAVEVLAPAIPLRREGEIRLTDDRKRGGRYALWVHGDVLRLRGHLLRTAEPREVEGVLGRPREVLGRQLEEALAAVGIALHPDAPAVDRELTPITSPLAPALAEMLQESSNFHAEQFVRVLGRELEGEGSLEAGQRALSRLLAGLVDVPAGAVQADGSGLSRENRVTPAMLASLLRAELKAGAEHTLALLEALPQGGYDGTLDDRFLDSPVRGSVRAKTGWIRGASALSGYVRTGTGELRVFSILMNYAPERGGLNRRLKREQERIVEAIAEL
jgi:D-alanyl-D-alanine carboxypeptidase/D-alanyl-D-alanine-endopeptidase (penicillin-binding protein 4)